jgi:hypothetical protein
MIYVKNVINQVHKLNSINYNIKLMLYQDVVGLKMLWIC